MTPVKQVCKLARFSLTTANASALAAFYETALGFQQIAAENVGGPDFERLMGVEGGAKRVTLGLGREIVELLQFERPGLAYPSDSSASDLSFQHFAIVVKEMGDAWQGLKAVAGWSAITRDGPQRLPKSSGGVTAFKFRDPEGHPLELLAFPITDTPQKWRTARGNKACLGIDHSAISVTNTEVSSKFYSSLGLRVSGHSSNQGPQQEALDDVLGVHVEVTALSPDDPDPHLELLCYSPGSRGRPQIYHSNDIAATRLILELCGRDTEAGEGISRTILDPDAHHLTMISTR